MTASSTTFTLIAATKSTHNFKNKLGQLRARYTREEVALRYLRLRTRRSL
jgi:hypothetical protein